MDEVLQELEKYAPGEVEAFYCVLLNVQELRSINVRFGHHRERFFSKVDTRKMVPPHAVLRQSGVETTKDIQKGESIGCKLATIMWVRSRRSGPE